MVNHAPYYYFEGPGELDFQSEKVQREVYSPLRKYLVHADKIEHQNL